MAVIPGDSRMGPLAPKYNLEKDTRDKENWPQKPKSSVNWVPMGVFFLFAMLAIPLTMQQLSIRQDNRQRAEGPLPTQVIPSPTPLPSQTPTETLSPTLTPTIGTGSQTASPTPELN